MLLFSAHQSEASLADLARFMLGKSKGFISAAEDYFEASTKAFLRELDGGYFIRNNGVKIRASEVGVTAQELKVIYHDLNFSSKSVLVMLDRKMAGDQKEILIYVGGKLDDADILAKEVQNLDQASLKNLEAAAFEQARPIINHIENHINRQIHMAYPQIQGPALTTEGLISHQVLLLNVDGTSMGYVAFRLSSENMDLKVVEKIFADLYEFARRSL